MQHCMLSSQENSASAMVHDNGISNSAFSDSQKKSSKIFQKRWVNNPRGKDAQKPGKWAASQSFQVAILHMVSCPFDPCTLWVFMEASLQKQVGLLSGLVFNLACSLSFLSTGKETELKMMVIVSILETSPHPKANSWLPITSHFFNVHLNASYSEDVKGFRSQVSGNKNKIQV